MATDRRSPGPENAPSAADIRAALADPESIAVEFQPILDVQGARTAGWEILTRFQCGPGVPTDRWFAAAYAAGLGAPLEAAVLGRGLVASRLRSPGTFITLNVTPTALAEPMIEQLLTAQAPLHGLVIELTEQLVPPNSNRCWQEACERLREMGAMIAIDDLGTGYAELVEILELRPDIIKLDRSVVATVDRDPAQRALVRFLGDFCGYLDAWVLAEGVERQEQLVALRELGVPLAQGWLTGRPHPTPQPCPTQLTYGTTRVHRPGSVGTVARPAMIVRNGSGCRPPDDAPFVLLDGPGRPTSVTLPPADGEPGATTAARLLVPPDLSLAEAARRAMARPTAARFDPLVCLDETGQVLGVIAVQDLVLTLADARAAATRTRPIAQRRPGPGQ